MHPPAIARGQVQMARRLLKPSRHLLHCEWNRDGCGNGSAGGRDRNLVVALGVWSIGNPAAPKCRADQDDAQKYADTPPALIPTWYQDEEQERGYRSSVKPIARDLGPLSGIPGIDGKGGGGRGCATRKLRS